VIATEASSVIREDDREEVIRERLHEFDLQTRPVADYYQAKGRLKTVNGDLPPDQVTAQIFCIIDNTSRMANYL